MDQKWKATNRRTHVPSARWSTEATTTSTAAADSSATGRETRHRRRIGLASFQKVSMRGTSEGAVGSSSAGTTMSVRPLTESAVTERRDRDDRSRQVRHGMELRRPARCGAGVTCRARVRRRPGAESIDEHLQLACHPLDGGRIDPGGRDTTLQLFRGGAGRGGATTEIFEGPLRRVHECLGRFHRNELGGCRCGCGDPSVFDHLLRPPRRRRPPRPSTSWAEARRHTLTVLEHAVKRAPFGDDSSRAGRIHTVLVRRCRAATRIERTPAYEPRSEHGALTSCSYRIWSVDVGELSSSVFL